MMCSFYSPHIDIQEKFEAVYDLDEESICYFARPLPASNLMIRRSGEGVGVEEYLNNGEGDERVFRILQYSAMECSGARKITEYSAL